MTLVASYDAAARAYADHLAGELAAKPLDRHLLNRFAEATRGRGLVADLGCGPAHVARYLHDQGVAMVGVDVSPGMVAVAREREPELDVRVGDMRRLDLADGSLAGAVAFYSIVHFDRSELPAVFAELRRVLSVGAPLLVAFHVGDRVVRVDDLFDVPTALDFVFHEPAAVAAALAGAGMPVVEHAEREPYPAGGGTAPPFGGAAGRAQVPAGEYPSRRAYLLARVF